MSAGEIADWMARRRRDVAGYGRQAEAAAQEAWNAAIRNHPLNIKPMPSAQTHWRIEHRVGAKPRFNPAQRYWHGTPDWAKVGTGAAVGHPAAAARAGRDGE